MAKEPDPTPQPLTGGALNRRLRRLGVAGRRARREWTRERVLEIGRTLLWTVPLTLLLWVWAQDQQIEEQTVPNVRVTLDHRNPQMAVTRLDRNGDGPLVTTLTLRGPRGGLTEVLRPLREQGAEGLTVELEQGESERAGIVLAQQLSSLPLFRDAGVTVTDTSPAAVQVRVEPFGELEVAVGVGGQLRESGLTGPIAIEPSRVTVRGPQAALDALEQLVADADGPTVVAGVRADDKSPPGEVQTREATIDLADVAREALVREVGAAEVSKLRLDPPVVAATYTRRERALEQYTIPTVSLWTSKPSVMEGMFEVAFPELSSGVFVINSVPVEGPPEVLQRMRPGGDLEGRVRAVLMLEPGDRNRPGETIQRQVSIELPDGVTLVGTPPTVAFRLVEPAT